MILIDQAQIGPGTIESPAVAVPAGTRTVLLQAVLNNEEPTVVWSYAVWWSFDGGATYQHAASASGGPGIRRSTRPGAYEWLSLQLDLPQSPPPTHIRAEVSLSARINIGLNGFLS